MRRSCVLLLSLSAVWACTLNLKRPGEVMQVVPFGSNGLRIRVAPGPTIPEGYETATLQTFPLPASCAEGTRSVSHGNLRVDIAGRYVTFYRISDGAVLLKEIARSFASSSLAGGDSTLFEATVQFAANTSERFMGMGQHRTGKFDQQHSFFQFERSQVYPESDGADITIPFYVSSNGYGFLWNVASFGHAAFEEEAVEWRATATKIVDFWVTTHPAQASRPTRLQSILQQYVEVTGLPPSMPPWSLGFWQCKLRYRAWEEIRSVVDRHLALDLPLAAIIIDFFHWPKFGDWRFDESTGCWGDVEANVAALAEQGVAVGVSVWPFSEQGSESFDEIVSRGWAVTDLEGRPRDVKEGRNWAWPAAAVLLDLFQEDVRRYFYDKVKAGYVDRGIKVLWLDGNEPERHDRAAVGHYRYAAGPEAAIGMAYPRMATRALAEGLAEDGYDDVVVLSRSAWAGSQRYRAFVWSGDVASTFEELALQVRAGLSMTMSGIPWWGTDIGGFWYGDTRDDYFRSVVVRWFQWATFTPLFRLHGNRQPFPDAGPLDRCGAMRGGASNEVWSYGERNARIFARFIRLREELFGYIQTHASEVERTGVSLMRPMVLEFDGDECDDAVDQFMFGPSLLVAPVLQHDDPERTVCLPRCDVCPGCKWREAFTGKEFECGSVARVQVPIEWIPVFIRPGSTSDILPPTPWAPP